MSYSLMFGCKEDALDYAREELAIQLLESVADMPLEDFLDSYRSQVEGAEDAEVTTEDLLAFRQIRVQQIFDGLAANESFLFNFLRGKW